MNNKKIAVTMSLLMGGTLSFFMSLLGNIMSGHFSLPGFIISFVISFIISIIIGLLIPVRKISSDLRHKFLFSEESMGGRCIDALISDFIYTPVIVLSMIIFACRMAEKQGGHIPFLPYFGKSLVLDLILGFILILIFTPIFIRLVVKHK
ncbi:hypothetical protein [Ruminococcus sp. XPD3002]|uniref:hypothetical protein n=1 Tax=Ruminococcus sp. XPD3002 TaxID=1452269 RepID=UPI000915BAA8|nr:hypothetical protein SAMN04487832_10371 [Ruminococcus flavefaciens]